MADRPLTKMPNPKRILLIYNPVAGPGAGRFRRRRFLRVKAALERLGCDVTVQKTARSGDAEAFARSADPIKIDVVVAAGGDGTINEVVNGLVGRNLPLGIVPLGTANVLAAEIGLSLRPRAIAAAIAEGGRLRCYPGLANGRYFMMMVGVGFDAHVVAKVSSTLKKTIGKGAYVWTAILEIFRNTPRQYEVLMGEKLVHAASVVIGKGRYYGGRYSCTPDARLDRATFQVCLFKRGGRWAVVQYIVGLARGTIPGMAGVTLVETDRIRISGRPGDPVQGDGDILAGLPLDVSISQNALDLLVPADTA